MIKQVDIEKDTYDLNYSTKLKYEGDLLLNEIEFCEIKRYFRLGFQDKNFDPYNYFKKLKYPKKKINKSLKKMKSNENLDEDQN